MQIEHYMDNARKRLLDVEQAILRFDFATADQRAYETLNREYQRLTRLVERWRQTQTIAGQLRDNRELLEAENDDEFRAVIHADIEALEARRAVLDRELKALILPPHPNEGRNIIIEIRPAAGGAEAGLFAAELYRMYSRYAEQNGWRRETLEVAETELGGIKAVAFSVQGAAVYGRLRHESGVHRVQRIPVTESGGRIHTSTVTVAVLPEAEEVDLHIAPDELHFDVFRSSGPGGQSVNTTDSAVRVTHLPTGMTVASQQEKSQHRNKEIALRILRSRLLDLKQAEETARNAAERRSQVGTGERSEKIRTYNFPQNRLTDHRFGITLHNLSAIIEGDLDGLLDEIAATYAERRLAIEMQ